jgi:predicted Fe-S protein YdhL (DUF1289 family)
MSEEVWKRAEIESPCIKLCVTHPESGLCMGCYRSLGEIARWSSMTPEERRAVMAELPARAPLVKGRRRGGRDVRER